MKHTNDIIAMAREVGFVAYGEDAGEYRIPTPAFHTRLERFAALVIANHPPQSSMAWQEGYEAGAAAEREACEKACKQIGQHGIITQCVNAIRARGQA
jgi:hypothetical protein